jgi:hypothetical protein
LGRRAFALGVILDDLLSIPTEHPPLSPTLWELRG